MTHPFNWLAFALTFVAAPLLVTALTFWFYLIPLYALILGGPLYVLLGGPLLVRHLRRHPPHYLPILLMALAAQLIQLPIILLAAAWMGDGDIISAIPFFLSMGAVFALLWSATFTFLYRCTTAARPFPEQES